MKRVLSILILFSFIGVMPAAELRVEAPKPVDRTQAEQLRDQRLEQFRANHAKRRTDISVQHAQDEEALEKKYKNDLQEKDKEYEELAKTLHDNYGIHLESGSTGKVTKIIANKLVESSLKPEQKKEMNELKVKAQKILESKKELAGKHKTKMDELNKKKLEDLAKSKEQFKQDCDKVEDAFNKEIGQQKKSLDKMNEEEKKNFYKVKIQAEFPDMPSKYLDMLLDFMVKLDVDMEGVTLKGEPFDKEKFRGQVKKIINELLKKGDSYDNDINYFSRYKDAMINEVDPDRFNIIETEVMSIMKKKSSMTEKSSIQGSSEGMNDFLQMLDPNTFSGMLTHGVIIPFVTIILLGLVAAFS